MALTPSNMLPLGTTAPDFNLLNTVDDSMVSLNEAKGTQGTLIMFICNHCPFVKHVNSELAQLAKDYKSQGINCISISSNDVENYPDDSPELMKANAVEHGFIFLTSMMKHRKWLKLTMLHVRLTFIFLIRD